MHRLGSGEKVPDIAAARKLWFEQGRTVSTFPGKAEFDAWEEDIGTLEVERDNGVQLRTGATLKTHSRGGTRKIVHNCLIVGNPAEIEKYQKERDQSPQPATISWAGWTFFSNRDRDMATATFYERQG